MAVKNEDVMALLLEAATSLRESLDTTGTNAIGDRIETHLSEKKGSKSGKKDLSGPDWRRYIYDIKHRTEKNLLEKKKLSRIWRFKLDIIASAFEYESFQDFLKKNNRTENSPVALYCGNWWSIVRANRGAYLYKAPLCITQNKDGRFILMMKGEHTHYKGTIHLSDGILYCSLSSEQHKNMYMVMKVGKSMAPSLLQGVFCTISNAGDPISGREVWQKEEVMNFDDMHWQKIPLNSKETEPVLIAYFTNEKDNCIKINNVSSFTLTDLN